MNHPIAIINIRLRLQYCLIEIHKTYIQMEIKVINTSNHSLPAYETESSAGMDIKAFVEEPIILKPMCRAMIPTGLFMEIPIGYEAQIRPRSGLAAKFGITVLNTPGTIDADYRGEVKVILINLSNEDFMVNNGDRIAQMVIAKHEKARWINTDNLSQTQRGQGGFGHTGKK